MSESPNELSEEEVGLDIRGPGGIVNVLNPRDELSEEGRPFFRVIDVYRRDSSDEDVSEGESNSPSPICHTQAMAEAETRLFDTQLSSLHSYMGADVVAVRGRTIFEEDTVINLDLLATANLILVPGQTLPLAIFDPNCINMLENCIKNDKTFGVLATYTKTGGSDNNLVVTSVGTTAEIYEYLPKAGCASLRIKAKARQRFKLVELDSSSNRRAKVTILPEVELQDPLDSVKLQALRSVRSSPSKHMRCRRADAALTHWPTFVYEQYNVERIMRDIKKELYITFYQMEKFKAATKKDVFPDNPTELSFWIAQNFPLRDEHRVMLLKLNSPIQRLRFELNAFKTILQILCCKTCRMVVGCSADMFCMSSEGTQGTYVNPNGYIHEAVTLKRVRNISTVDLPCANFSWFPGYMWTICICNHCGQHVGWKFTSDDLKPSKFWALSRQSLFLQIKEPQEDTEHTVVL